MTTNGHNETLTEELKRGREEARELGAEVADIVADLRTLGQKEAQLAQAEIREQLMRSVRGLAAGATAAILGLLLLTFLSLTVMFALWVVLPMWASALIVSLGLAALAAIGGALAYAQIKRITVVPKRTVNSIREDLEWARSQMRSSAR